MTSLAHLYQDFGRKPSGYDGGVELGQSEIEDQKLASFESGYQAGWEDAVNAQKDSVQSISSDFAKNLQDASFNYHEARAELVKSLRPFFTDIANTLLPSIAQQTLGAHIVEQLHDMTRDQLDQVIEVTICPQNATAVDSILNENLPEPFVLVEDETLGAGQVYLRIGANERQIDMDQVVASVSDAMTIFFQQSQEDVSDE